MGPGYCFHVAAGKFAQSRNLAMAKQRPGTNQLPVLYHAWLTGNHTFGEVVEDIFN